MNTLGMRRWWALGALALDLLAVGLDLTVLNLALPTLATDLHASNAQLQWFVDAYGLVLAAMLLPAGLLGDRFGRKKLLLGALALFGVASLSCAYATTAGALIASRAVLGLGGAFLMPLSMSVLTVLFSPQERPRAIAVWVAANAVSWPIGPILGGWLLDNYWWGSVFLINVPVTIIGLLAVAALLPESRSSERPRVDFIGVLLSSAGLVGLTYGAIEAGQKGWGNPVVAASLAAGALLLVAFVLAQRGIALRPEGQRLLPIIGGLLVGSKVAERLARRAGAKITVAIGFVLLAAGLATGAASGVHSGYGFAATWVSIIGLGIGFTLPTAMDAALSALSPERSGVGSGVIQALRQVGGTIGVAVLGTVLSSAYHARLDLAGLPAQAASAVRDSVSAGVAVAHQLGSAALLDSVRAASVHGMDVMLLVCGGIALLGIVLTITFLPRRAATVETTPSEPAIATSEEEVGVCGDCGDRETRARSPRARAARTKESQNQGRDPPARPAPVPRTGLRRHHRGTDRRRSGGLAEHVLPLLPNQGRRGARRRPRPAHDRGIPSPTTRPAPHPRPAKLDPRGLRPPLRRRVDPGAATAPADPHRPRTPCPHPGGNHQLPPGGRQSRRRTGRPPPRRPRSPHLLRRAHGRRPRHHAQLDREPHHRLLHRARRRPRPPRSRPAAVGPMGHPVRVSASTASSS